MRFLNWIWREQQIIDINIIFDFLKWVVEVSAGIALLLSWEKTKLETGKAKNAESYYLTSDVYRCTVEREKLYFDCKYKNSCGLRTRNPYLNAVAILWSSLTIHERTEQNSIWEQCSCAIEKQTIRTSCTKRWSCCIRWMRKVFRSTAGSDVDGDTGFIISNWACAGEFSFKNRFL